MELDDLKKSWNALDEHLKSKEFIEEKEIAQLLGRARNKMNSIDRFNASGHSHLPHQSVP